MPKAWEWTPGAEAMDEGAKASALRKTLQSREDLAQQAHTNELAKMLYGQQLKTQEEERQAGLEAPAIEGLLRGNKEIAGTFGIEGQPTPEQIRGLSRSKLLGPVLGKQIEAKQPFTLKPGQTRYSPSGQPIAQAPLGSGLYETPLAAQQAWEQMQATNPNMSKAYRPQVMVDPQGGGYRLNLQSAEPMNIQDPFKVEAEYLSKGTPVPPEVSAAAQQYQDRLAASAGAKQQAIVGATPLTPEQQTQQSQLEKAREALYTINTGFSEGEKKAFVGLWNRGVKDILSVAQEIPFVGAYVGSVGPKFSVERFQQFKAQMGLVEQLKFAIAGKQLTVGEQGVIEAAIPTGKEKSYAEFAAKMKYAEGIVKAQQVTTLYLSKTPREYVNLELLGNMYRQALKNEGIDLDNKNGWMKNMSPSDRAKSKYLLEEK